VKQAPYPEKDSTVFEGRSYFQHGQIELEIFGDFSSKKKIEIFGANQI
jgi:hypothetical protein